MEDRFGEAELRRFLIGIQDAERRGNYQERNHLIVHAVGWAMMADFHAGFRFDPEEPHWPCAFIQLPQGQVSWHLPEFPFPWDGHDTEEKNRRIREYLGDE